VAGYGLEIIWKEDVRSVAVLDLGSFIYESSAELKNGMFSLVGWEMICSTEYHSTFRR
jgi:hypothetical protein